MGNNNGPPPNPYAAPSARVEDVDAQSSDGAFTADGQRVPASHGLQWIGDGLSMYKEYPLLWIVIGLAFLLLTALGELVPIVGDLIAALLGPFWVAGIVIGCQSVARKAGLRVSHLFAGFGVHSGRLLMFGVINAAVVYLMELPGGLEAGGATALIALVFLALSVPYAMLVWYGPPLIALSGQGLGASLRGSFLGCARNWLPLLVYSLIFFAIGLVMIIIVGALGGFAIISLIAGSGSGAAPGSVMASAGLSIFVLLVIIALTLPLFFTSFYASFQDIFYRRSG